jgi:adenylate kinase
MSEHARAVVLFGPPGSGKGTQAKILIQRWGVPHISTGDMLRAHIASGDSIGSEVSALMRSGGLVPDAMVNLLVKRRLAQPDCARGFILDGFPRTAQQAGTLEGWLEPLGIRELVIYLAVDYNVIISRLAGRRQCALCGALYNVVFNPPKIEGLCDVDGRALFTRDDDAEHVIRQRLEAYERQTKPLLEYFCGNGRRVVEVVAGDEPPAVLADKICRTVEAE